MSTTSSVLYLGASRGVGFAAYTTLAATRKDVQSVLLLRSTSSFKQTDDYKHLDPEIIARTTLVEGNAHSQDDIRTLLKNGGDNVEAIVFSIGYTPPTGFKDSLKILTNGFAIDPPDLCSRGLINVLKVLAESYPGDIPKPKLIIVSSMGIGAEAHKLIPFSYKFMYSVLLKSPHADKLAMEVATAEALLPPSSSTSPSPLPRFFPSPAEINPSILSPETYASLPRGFLRPAFFNDSPPKGTYRVEQEGSREAKEGKGMYTIGRKDLGGFVARLLGGGSGSGGGAKDGEDDVKKWWGHQVVVAY